ncbi:Negative elongation factor C/D [Toxocara canis]|uniref:Negative elongation factor C/D n=1 Tax=Toxocara canis TaxID=6265 RepID=A0A0B2UY06_TOXCA|nr:Negative elongation factor C/D [Toxocara canis]
MGRTSCMASGAPETPMEEELAVNGERNHDEQMECEENSAENSKRFIREQCLQLLKSENELQSLLAIYKPWVGTLPILDDLYDFLTSNDWNFARFLRKQKFVVPDFVMEPQVFDVLGTFFKCGGEPDVVIDSLSDNYASLGQICNVLGDMLEDLEGSRTSVEQCYESTLSKLILERFQPELADKIFDSEDGHELEWLAEFISHKNSRHLVYSLVEKHPDSTLLNYCMKLISEEGFQNEISHLNITTQRRELFSSVLLSAIDAVLKEHRRGPMTDAYEKAFEKLVKVVCHGEHTYLYTQALLHVMSVERELFSSVLLSAIDAVLKEHRRGPMTDAYEKAFEKLVKVVCHGEHTYLYTQALLHVMSVEEQGMEAAACAHISQSLRAVIQERGQDPSQLYIALLQSNGEHIAPDAIQAMHIMVDKKCLNPADISVLYREYTSPNPPPVELIRDPYFLDMLIDSLFAYDGVKVHKEYLSMYIYLLAYATCVGEKKNNGVRTQNRRDLDPTRDVIEELLTLLRSKVDLAKEVKRLLNSIEVPVVAAGMLHYLRGVLLSKDMIGRPQVVHLVLLDQIATSHPNLQMRVFGIICDLYDRHTSSQDLTEEVMERQRVVIDRFVHLLSVGLVLPVVEKMSRMYRDGYIDSSLMRYFAIEVLQIVCPPYSQDFTEVFLPIVSNKEIFIPTIHDKFELAKEFVDHCAQQLNSSTTSLTSH